MNDYLKIKRSNIVAFLICVIFITPGYFFLNPTQIFSLLIVPFLFAYIIYFSNQRIFFLVQILFGCLFGVCYSWFSAKEALYFVYDFAAMIIAFQMLYLVSKVDFANIEKFSKILYLYVVSYIFGSIYYSSIDDSRYAGPLLNVNLGVYFLGYGVIFLFLKLSIDKKISNILFIFIILQIILFYVMSISESRSTLFFILLIMAIMIDLLWRRKKKYIAYIAILMSFVGAVFGVSMGMFGDRINAEETSFLTRSLITLDLMSKAFDLKGVPQGPRFSVDYVVAEYGNPEMHPHNDVLAGILDYGVFYLIFILLLIRFWFIKFNINLISVFMLLVYFSSALHGYFGSTLLLLPAIYLSEIYRRYLINNFKSVNK